MNQTRQTVSPTERHEDIDGVRICFTDSGETDLHPVIIMHGWGCNSSTVASIANIFSGKMRVINIDLPGHGKSSEPKEVWGIEKFTAAIEELARRLDLKSPSLIGHSFGGRISILMGSRNDISKIVLVDAAGIKPRRTLRYYLKVYSFKTMKHLALMFGEAGRKFIDRRRAKAGSADYRNSSPMMRAVMSVCVNEDLKHVMPSIKAPTLLIWGENDTATPLNDAKTMERLIPDAGLVSFPGCGHYSFLDAPGQFKSVINEFFKLNK